MLVVRVELWSAVTGERSEIARMHICNEGGSLKRGDYSGTTFTGRTAAALDRRVKNRTAWVTSYPRLDLHVWNLVSRMLTALGYNGTRLGCQDYAAGEVERAVADP